MNTDRETRTRIAAMAAAEAAIERDPRDPFEVLDVASAEAADNLGVDPQAVYDLADGIIVETLVDGPRAAALRAERDAVSLELAEARRGVAIEVRAAVAGVVTAKEGVAGGARGVEQATETLRVERERHAAGRITTNNLLEAEAALRTSLEGVSNVILHVDTEEDEPA